MVIYATHVSRMSMWVRMNEHSLQSAVCWAVFDLPVTQILYSLMSDQSMSRKKSSRSLNLSSGESNEDEQDLSVTKPILVLQKLIKPI
jgi:hypothetical protein